MAGHPRLDQLIRAFEPLSCSPGDSDDVRARKARFTLAMTLIIPAGVLWSGLYWSFGARAAALSPLVYAVLSAANLLVLRRTRSFRWFQTTELALILQLQLGGYVGGSAVVVWALLAPFFAVLFATPREAIGWFAAFEAEVLLAWLLQPTLLADNALPAWLIAAFFLLNVGSVSAIAFAMLVSFVWARHRLRSLELATSSRPSCCASRRSWPRSVRSPRAWPTN